MSESRTSTFKVTLLGTGIPDPKPTRFGSSTLVEVGDEKLIFDCGRCVLQRYYETGMPLKDVKNLFLTHLHSDHTVGIPDLWLTPWIFGRWEEPFRVWGPPGTKIMMEKLEEAFEYDLKIRPVHDLLPTQGSKILVQEIEEGLVYDQKGIRVTAFNVDHRPVKPSYGYRVDYKGRSLVISGDTRFCENLIRHAKKVDLLVHNVGAAREEDLRKSERLRKIMTLHSSPEKAGEVFTLSETKFAVYTHLALFGVRVEEVVRRTRKTYKGPLEVGEDLMSFEIGDEIIVMRHDFAAARTESIDFDLPL